MKVYFEVAFSANLGCLSSENSMTNLVFLVPKSSESVTNSWVFCPSNDNNESAMLDFDRASIGSSLPSSLARNLIIGKILQESLPMTKATKLPVGIDSKKCLNLSSNESKAIENRYDVIQRPSGS